MTSDLQWAAAAALIQQANHVVLTTHSVVKPDGDAIGSLVGLTLALQAQGKTVLPLLDTGVPSHFRFLEGTELVQTQSNNITTADLGMVLDCSSLKIAGDAGQQIFQMDIPTLVIDHHMTNERYGQVNLIGKEHLATCEILLDLMEYLGWSINPAVANALLLGTITDTNGLSIDRVSTPTLERVNKLVALGANLPRTLQLALHKKPHNALRLAGRVLSRLQMDNGLIWSVVRREDVADLGLEAGNHYGLANQLISDEQARLSALFIEVENGVAVELRCLSAYNVGDYAFSMGGGGHQQASGFRLNGFTVEAAVEQILPDLLNLLGE